MKVYEIINELTFHGSKCTKDCSGHRAGWYWARKHNKSASQCNGSSQSFKNGCGINAYQRAQGKNLIGPSIRGDKGKFTKFQKSK